MNVVIFGATGMVGQGVLRECLLDPDVQRVVTVGRSPTGQRHEKLREIVRADLLDFSDIDTELSGLDACFYCLGVSSGGTPADTYRRVTYDITVAAAQTLVKLNPGMTFILVSGAGADSTGRSRTMWARVKGEAENAVLRLPFRAAYVFRPAVIQPLHGITSRTKAYRVIYAMTKSIFPVLLALFPNYVTTTEHLGRAMLGVAKDGYSKRVLESRDIAALKH